MIKSMTGFAAVSLEDERLSLAVTIRAVNHRFLDVQLRLPQAERDRAVQTLRLAEQLGAETVTVPGQRMSDEILALAHARNVTKIVVGKPARSLWKRILMGSIVDALVEGSGDIDVYVISAEREENALPPAQRRPFETDWWAYGEAVLKRQSHRLMQLKTSGE